jgi:formate dehydrogenase subunit gamma
LLRADESSDRIVHFPAMRLRLARDEDFSPWIRHAISVRAISDDGVGRCRLARRDEILRFRTSERHLHWAIAMPFMVSYATALILVVIYNPYPGRPYRSLFSWMHRASGIWLTILPIWAMVTHRDDAKIYLQNVREAWRWTVDDVKWLMLMGPATISSRVTLPDQGKFNAAEKINFMMVMATYPLYIVTGLLIWLPGVTLTAWLVHFSMAAVATPLLLGHIFMATVNRETRAGLSGMFSGYVSREWAKHHYRRWYDETFARDEVAAAPAAPVMAPPVLSVPPPRVWSEVRPVPRQPPARPSQARGADRAAPVPDSL